MKQLFMHAIVGECGGGGGDAVRTPQSTQSVLNVHKRMEVSKHGFEHMFGGGYGAGCAAGDRGGGDGDARATTDAVGIGDTVNRL